MKGRSIPFVTMALAMPSLISAALSSICPASGVDICYALNIPDVTARSGNGDIFFQMKAPTTYSWVGLGQGSQMAGANIFVMYTSADGQNVTVSPRHGIGHVMPKHANTTSQITLLEGSGVSGGMMMANVRCSNCQSWPGGSMDFTDATANWIMAGKQGEPLNSDSLDETIRFHDVHGPFMWSLAAAKGGNDVNPFVDSAPAATSSASSSAFMLPPHFQQVKEAHGFLAALSWVIFFPAGAIIIRLGRFSGTLLTHRIIQIFSMCLFTAAVGMGAWVAYTIKMYDHHHPIIGTIVFILMLMMPVYGQLHHVVFKKVGRRNVWSWLHIFIGRVVIILAMINGGLGLMWSAEYQDLRSPMIAYGVIAGVMGVTYLTSIGIGEWQRSKATRASASVGSTEGTTDSIDEAKE